MKIAAIIPAYNEELTIASVIRSLAAEHPGIEIIVVNDGSRDGTGRMARSAGASIVIDLPVNVGIGGAMQTGYLYAWRSGCDIAVQIDADGQHDPEELRKIVLPVLEGRADCCIGSRFVHKTAYRSSVSRRLGIRFFSWMVYGMTGLKVADPTSGFRAVNRQVIGRFAQDYPHDYPEVEAIVLLSRLGYRVEEASVTMHRRQAGKSSITPFKSMYYMLKVSLAVMMTRLREG